MKYTFIQKHFVSKTKAYLRSIKKSGEWIILRSCAFVKIIAAALFDFLYSLILFQLYFLLTFIACAFSTDQIWGKDGTIATTSKISFLETGNTWNDHYYWYFFSTLIALAIGSILAGLVTKKISNWKSWLLYSPNSIFLIWISYLIISKSNMLFFWFSDLSVFFIANLLLIIFGNALVPYCVRLGRNVLPPVMNFNKFHFLWLSIPYGFYLSGFIYALSVHSMFIWYDLKDVLRDRFDFSFKHFVRDLLNNLTIFPAILELIIDLLITWALKIWYYPIQYTLEYLNGNVLLNKKRFNSALIIFAILVFGLPIATIVEILCYYLLGLIDRIF